MKRKQKKITVEIKDYDTVDTTEMINRNEPLKFEDVSLKLPTVPPTQVISIRIPTELLNQIRAIGSQEDVPYQALIKLILSEGVKKRKDKKTA